jgi:hypothetical protein
LLHAHRFGPGRQERLRTETLRVAERAVTSAGVGLADAIADRRSQPQPSG